MPQSSVLAPLLSIIYVKDLDSGLVNKICRFADDPKMSIKADNYSTEKWLQNDLLKRVEWSVKWQIPFNLNRKQSHAHKSQK